MTRLQGLGFQRRRRPLKVSRAKLGTLERRQNVIGWILQDGQDGAGDRRGEVTRVIRVSLDTGGVHMGEDSVKMGTDVFIELVGGCLELCEAFVSVILQLSNSCKADSVFFLQGGKLRRREIQWLAKATQPDVESRAETSGFSFTQLAEAEGS